MFDRAKYMRAYRRKIADQGLCIDCHKPRDRKTGTRCQSCLDKENHTCRQSYRLLKQQNICTRCHGPIGKMKGATCRKCQDYITERQRRYRKRWTEEGRCLVCSAPLTEYEILRGISGCTQCVDYQSQYNRGRMR